MGMETPAVELQAPPVASLPGDFSTASAGTAAADMFSSRDRPAAALRPKRAALVCAAEDLAWLVDSLVGLDWLTLMLMLLYCW